MHPFLRALYAKAKNSGARILLPEPHDPRILEAAAKIEKLRIANPVLLGDPKTIPKLAKGYSIELTSEIIDIASAATFAQRMYELRREKGMTLPEAQKLIAKPCYAASMLVLAGKADGYVSGSLSPTADTLRPALQLIRTTEGKAFSYFILLDKKRVDPYFFADCGFIVDPTAEELAAIAIGTARIAQSLGVEPRVAMLSYSTKGSGEGPNADKVRRATALAQQQAPELLIDGELQFDAAFVPEVAKRKAPHSRVAGRANIFIFPDLGAGNIGYKIAERLGGLQAIGPLVAGMNRPVHDLSRGCSVDDIVAAVAMAAIEAKRPR